jgi:hypothetical protein
VPAKAHTTAQTYRVSLDAIENLSNEDQSGKTRGKRSQQLSPALAGCCFVGFDL